MILQHIAPLTEPLVTLGAVPGDSLLAQLTLGSVDAVLVRLRLRVDVLVQLVHLHVRRHYVAVCNKLHAKPLRTLG